MPFCVVRGDGRMGLVGLVAKSKDRSISMALASCSDPIEEEDTPIRCRRLLFIADGEYVYIVSNSVVVFASLRFKKMLSRLSIFRLRPTSTCSRVLVLVVNAREASLASPRLNISPTHWNVECHPRA